MNNDDLPTFGDDELPVLTEEMLQQPLGVLGTAKKYLIDEPERLKRQALSRGFEGAVGVFGDLEDLANSLLEGAIGYATGTDVSGTMESMGQQSGVRFPRTGELRQAIGQATDFAYEPESGIEEFAGNVMEDLGALVSTSATMGGAGKVPFAKTIGQLAVANAGKQAVKELGGSEAQQDLAKIGLLVMGGLASAKGLGKHRNNLYSRAREAISPDATTSTRTISQELASVEKELAKGVATDAKRDSLRIIEEFRPKIQGGEVKVEELWELHKDINEMMRKPGLSNRARGFLQQTKNGVTKSLEEYGKTNASFAEALKEANQIHAGLAISDKVQGFARSNLSPKSMPYVYATLGMGAMMDPAAAAKVAGGALAASGAAYGIELSRRIATNPAMRRYYGNVIKHAMDGNRTAFLRSANQLNKALKKDLENEPLEEFQGDVTLDDGTTISRTLIDEILRR